MPEIINTQVPTVERAEVSLDFEQRFADITEKLGDLDEVVIEQLEQTMQGKLGGNTDTMTRRDSNND